MEIVKWNSEINVLTPSLNIPTHWAYSLNTQKGQFRMEISKSKVVSKSERGFEFTSIEENIKLMLDANHETQCIMDHITVWPTNYYEVFMIFHNNITGAVYIIDSSGIIYELPCKMSTGKLWNPGNVKRFTKEGYYLVNSEVKLYFRTRAERQDFKEKSKPIQGAEFNKDFNKFVRAEAHNEKAYLYLTAGNSKCGAFIDCFSNQGMDLEVLPNLLLDDDTINVRIPLFGDNASKKEVHYLFAKYQNTYSIYGIPFTQIGGGLEIPEKHKRILNDNSFYMPKGKEALIYSIIETIRCACKATDDYDLYKKSLSKIVRLLSKNSCNTIENSFNSLMLLHPKDMFLNDEYVISNIDYINSLLQNTTDIRQKEIEEIRTKIEEYRAKGYDMSDFEKANEERCKSYEKGKIEIRETPDDENQLFGQTQNIDYYLYSLAYSESKKNFKNAMLSYESEILGKLSEQGIKFSRWKNESDLFTLVKKNYPDAIYQYHVNWLGLQSLDIYIPSINIGIEYQGEQHYRPIDFFGGEAAFASVIERDKRKAELCKQNGVHLIYWKYDEVISKNNLIKKIETIDV